MGSSYCPPDKRYDVGAFPPRCLDCVRVFSNRMQMVRIPTALQTRRAVQKFSPGLPQNRTCGCWRTPANQTVFDVALNASWIVSGLSFTAERRVWLKEFEVHASENNATYIPWGLYSTLNFTSASTVLFTYPIRARYFRVVVRKYANHYVDTSSGFPLLPVQALVSRDQPFSCGCPTLLNGECCPFQNMTIRNNTCVWCMDPADIRTRMVDGCAKCKPGNFEHLGRCYQSIQTPSVNSMRAGNARSDGIEWMVQVNYTTDARSLVLLFITNKTANHTTHPCMGTNPLSSLSSACCIQEYYESRPLSSSRYTPIMWNFTPPLGTNQSEASLPDGICSVDSMPNPPATVKQFVQFDRGRQSLALSFTEKDVRAWADCGDTVCVGTVGALFITRLSSALPTALFLPQLIQQPLRFDMRVPSLVCTAAQSAATQTRAELHYYAATDTYIVRLIGVALSGDQLQYQWTNTAAWTFTPNAPEPVVTAPPLNTALRIGNHVHMFRIDPPITPVVHGAVKRSALAGILVEVMYGFGFKMLPTSGDTDQIVIIAAKSTQPVRLKRLATIFRGETTQYTNAKGFISDSKRVMDLGVACYQDKALMARWLLQAIQLLDTPGLPYEDFIQRSCRMILTGDAAKAFWLVPWRGGPSVDRLSPAGVETVAEFA